MIDLALILLIAAIFGEITHRLKCPRIVGYIIAGMILKFLNFPISNEFLFLKELGIIFLLFLVGLEINLKEILNSLRDSFIPMFLCVGTTFIFGFIVGKILNLSDVACLVLGAALAVTAKGAKSAVLLEFKAINTKLGQMMLLASIVDDIFEILFLSIVVLILQAGSPVDYLVRMLYLILIVGFVYFLFIIFPKILKILNVSDELLFTISIFLCLFIAGVCKKFNIGLAIGAFFAGIIVNHFNKDFVKIIEPISLYFLCPFFFVYVGYKFEIVNNLDFLLILLASLTPILGGLISSIFTRLSKLQGILFGLSMLSRGEMGLIIALIALENNLLSPEIYSGILLAIIFGDILFPVLFSLILKLKGEKILD